jgi:hypothetical protein
MVRRMNQRLLVKDAAELLGISSAAVRSRIHRGTLRSEKDEDGTVYVLLDGDASEHSAPNNATNDKDRLINVLEEQLRIEREASAELRKLLAGALQRVPEIESSEPLRADLSARDGSGNGGASPEPQEPAQRRSWLYRFFFGVV